MSVREKTQRHLNRLAAAAAVASTVASAEACNKESGYGVVDPMPPPSRCSGAAASIKATAQWIDTPKGRRIEFLIDQPTTGSFKLGDLTKLVSPESQIEEATPTATGYRLVVELKYPPYFNYTLPVSCTDATDAGVTENVQLNLDTSSDSGPLKPSLSEY